MISRILDKILCRQERLTIEQAEGIIYKLIFSNLKPVEAQDKKFASLQYGMHTILLETHDAESIKSIMDRMTDKVITLSKCPEKTEGSLV